MAAFSPVVPYSVNGFLAVWLVARAGVIIRDEYNPLINRNVHTLDFCLHIFSMLCTTATFSIQVYSIMEASAIFLPSAKKVGGSGLEMGMVSLAFEGP